MNKLESWNTWNTWKTKSHFNSKKYLWFIKIIFQNELFLTSTLPSGPTDKLTRYFMECPIDCLRKAQICVFYGRGYQKRRNQKAQGFFLRLSLQKRRRNFLPLRLSIVPHQKWTTGMRAPRSPLCLPHWSRHFRRRSYAIFLAVAGLGTTTLFL